MKHLRVNSLRNIVMIIAVIGITACGSTNTSQGASTGAVVGGLVGGWEGMATGALIGGGVGLMADSAEDKKIQQQQKEKELAILEKSRITADAKTTAQPENNNKLTGSTWRVVSLVDEENKTGEFSSIILSFQTNTRATTLILWADGKSETYSERYSVVGDALIFTGKDYVTNSKYSINGKQMVLVTQTFRCVLEEVEEGI
jgi:outer membrane lipoprotein SlyB